MHHQGAERAPWETSFGQCDSVFVVTPSQNVVTSTSNTLVFAKLGEDRELVKEAQIATDHTT